MIINFRLQIADFFEFEEFLWTSAAVRESSPAASHTFIFKTLLVRGWSYHKISS